MEDINSTIEVISGCRIGSEIIPEREDPSIRIHFVIAEGISAVLSTIGNAFVIYVFITKRQTRCTRNYYIASLADFLMGVMGTPFSISISLGYPQNFIACRFGVSSIMFLSAVSIYGIVAVAFDRYLATSDPFAYYRVIHTPTAIGICVACWGFGGLIGFLPLFGWYNPYGEACFVESGFCLFTDVIHDTYLQFFYVFNVLFLTVLLIGFYGAIYRIIVTKRDWKTWFWFKPNLVMCLTSRICASFSLILQTIFSERQIRTECHAPIQSDNVQRNGMSSQQQRRSDSLDSGNQLATSCGGLIEHISIGVGRYRWEEVKAAKKVGIIIFFFMVCWMPSTILNLLYTFVPSFNVSLDILDWAVILSHANSALNPFLYAYHLKEFRSAMIATIRKTDFRDKRFQTITPGTRSRTITNESEETNISIPAQISTMS